MICLDSVKLFDDARVVLCTGRQYRDIAPVRCHSSHSLTDFLHYQAAGMGTKGGALEVEELAQVPQADAIGGSGGEEVAVLRERERGHGALVAREVRHVLRGISFYLTVIIMYFIIH